MPYDEPYFGKHTSFQIKGRTKLAFIQNEIKAFTFKSLTKALWRKNHFLCLTTNLMRYYIPIFFTYLGKGDIKGMISHRKYCQKKFWEVIQPVPQSKAGSATSMSLLIDNSSVWSQMLQRTVCYKILRKYILMLHCPYGYKLLVIQFSSYNCLSSCATSNLLGTLLTTAFQLRFEQCWVYRRITGCVLQRMLCLYIAVWYLLSL